MIDNLKKYGEVYENYDLTNHNTYKIKTSTKYLVLPKDKDNLKDLIKYLKENNHKYLVLGNASNVILPDNMFEGTIIKLDKLNNINLSKDILEVDGGVMINTICAYLFNHNYVGFLWATGIPGTIGGSILGNAGAYKESIFDNLISINILDENNNIVTLKKEEIDYSYRYTSLKSKNIIILSAKFKVSKGNIDEAKALVLDRKKRRIDSQPLEYPSAGSVFRNPIDDYAGRLIEECGLKGKIIGGAQISEKHANFIINYNNATSKDIKELIKLAMETVENKFKIKLILEQIIIKWD